MSERLVWHRPRTPPYPGPLLQEAREVSLALGRERREVRAWPWTLNTSEGGDYETDSHVSSVRHCFRQPADPGARLPRAGGTMLKCQLKRRLWVLLRGDYRRGSPRRAYRRGR